MNTEPTRPWGIVLDVEYRVDPAGFVAEVAPLSLHRREPPGPLVLTGHPPYVQPAQGGGTAGRLVWWESRLQTDGWDHLRRALHALPRDQRPTGPLGMWLYDFDIDVSSLGHACGFAVRAGLAVGVRVFVSDAEGHVVPTPTPAEWLR